MKKIIYILFGFVGISFADLSVEQIQHMVKQIHEKRKGVELETLERTKEPFIKIEENNNSTVVILPNKVNDSKFLLHAVMNKQAYINDSWKKEGDIILGYKLVYIGKSGVVMRNDNQIKKLFLHRKNNDFILLKERE